MSIPLKNLTTTKRKHPPLLSVYGTAGIGKTTLAAEFPSPLYLFTEGEEPPTDIELTTLTNENGEPKPIESYTEILDVFEQLLTEDHDFKTVIIDSLDSFEKMVWAYTCEQKGGAREGWDTIDSNDKGSPTAFGKGYLAADEYWNDYISAVRALARNGIHVVQLIHSEAKKWEDPVVDAYMRYKPNLQDRAMKLIKDKSDALLFISKRTSVKQVDKGFGKKESKVEGMSGSERVIFTDERAGFHAKNRLNMPPSIPYRKGSGFDELSKYFYSPNNDNSSLESGEPA
ncbi:ATP-binding protein [Nitratireductor kimnyeongensis]|uniref:ATP-binding protein n=1 Tax=Nitratireductor kimnyeongensis TaxID=430679 RepID=A0ABW0T7A5_9HYPH|nr:ATP-binding protein [Nitratireductor kimnyeongensis]QZZ34544.1 ATP-binding protein [Nitratireductor kimnyeongensis]